MGFAHFGRFHCSKKLVASKNVELAKVVEITRVKLARGYCTIITVFISLVSNLKMSLILSRSFLV